MPLQPAARADDPVTLSRDGQITDKVGALGDRRGQVVAALDRLYADRRIQLFVVYVRDFSGRSAQNWADETADKNGLGLDDVLLAVATHDRQYAYTVEPGSRLTDAQLRDVANTAIEPALKQNDWAGAAIGAANGYAAVVAGKPVPTPAVTPGIDDPGTGSSGGTSTGDLILPVVLVGGAGAVAAYAYTRRRRRTTTRTTPGATGWGQGAAPSGGPPRPPTPLPDLDAHAKQALVETDDAVRTSEEELGFATAQFGEEAAAPFTEAATYAKGELTAAFRLRQQLDDAFPEDDATRRRMLDEIINRCTGANARLDAVSEDFDRLRALERNAPQALATAETAFRALAGRVSAAETTLTSMRGRYADSASSSVAGDIEQAKDRLVFTTSNLNQARQAVDGGNNAAAAVYVRAAEGAVDQATTLVDAVDRRARELAEAAAELPAALTETATDLADAGGLLEGTSQGVSTADLRGRIARAQSVLGDVNRELQAYRYDPIDALRRVEEADAALDEALAGAREREQGDRRARALFDQAMLTSRSAIAAAADYITTNRGPSAARPGPGSRRPSGGWSGPGSWPARTIHRVRWPRPNRPTRWPGRHGAWPKRMCGRTGTGTVRAVYKEGAAGLAVRSSAGSSSADSWAAAGAAGVTEGVRRRIRWRRRPRQLRRRGHSRPTGRRRPLLNHRQSMHGEGTHGSVPRS